jgi:hypothetical protein
MMTPPVLRPLSAGEILDLSFSLYRRHFGSLAVVVMLCSGLPLLLNIYIESSGGVLAHPVAWFGYLLLLVILGSVATAASVFIVSESYLGRSLSAGDALTRATPYVGQLVLYSIMFSLIVGIGTMLLIVPGVILACGLVLATPIIVLETNASASAALGRSWALTKGSRGKIFGLMLTLVVLLVIPIFAIGAVGAMLLPAAPDATALGGTSKLFVVAAAGVVQMFVYPMLYCVLTIAYYDLRVRKEGFDLEVLASSLQPA